MRSRLIGRLLVTALAPVALYFAYHVPLPQIDLEAAKAIITSTSGDWPPASLTLFALGLTPMISAFVLVELAALLVSRWRPLRIGPPEERARLDRPTVIVGLIVAGIQSWFMYVWIRGLPTPILREDTAALALPLSLVGGMMCLVVLAHVVGRWGVANGFSVLLGLQVLVDTARAGISLGAEDALATAVAAASVVFATIWILRSRSRAGNVSLRLPASGVVPLGYSADVVGFYVVLASFGVTFPDNPAVHVALGSGLCVLFSWLFSRPSLLRDVVPDAAGSIRNATPASVLYVVALVACDMFLRRPLGAPLLAVATAVVMDIVAEARARARLDLVSVWPIHRVQTADLALGALRDEGIEAHLRGANHRTLLFFFGPFVPIEVLVRRDQAERAATALRLLFSGRPAAVFD